MQFPIETNIKILFFRHAYSSFIKTKERRSTSASIDLNKKLIDLHFLFYFILYDFSFCSIQRVYKIQPLYCKTNHCILMFYCHSNVHSNIIGFVYFIYLHLWSLIMAN